MLIICLTGCSVDYHLDIDKNLKLNETVKVTANNKNDVQSIQDFSLFVPIDIRVDDYSSFQEKSKELEYYNIEKDKDNQFLQFDYLYDSNQFNYDMIVSTCYQYVTSMQRDDKLILSTSKEFLCYDIYDDLEDVSVTITSRYKLIDTNADYKEKYKYTWYINRQNYQDRVIYLELDTSNRSKSWWELFQNSGFYQYGVIIFIFFVIFLILIFIKKRGIKRNRV